MSRSQPGEHCLELPFSRCTAAVCVLQAAVSGGSHFDIQRAYTMSFQPCTNNTAPGID